MRLKAEPVITGETRRSEGTEFGVADLRVEYRRDPIGIGVRVPDSVGSYAVREEESGKPDTGSKCPRAIRSS